MFFRSEEHARNHDLGARALYWDLDAAAYLTPIVQSALFGLAPTQRTRVTTGTPEMRMTVGGDSR